MGWSIGYDDNWKRDIGYGVTAQCDHPGCGDEIDRGLSHVCANDEPYGGDGCGLYFCDAHMFPSDLNDGFYCERCCAGQAPFDATPDLRVWIDWKLSDWSWQRWRDENPDEVAKLRAAPNC